MCIKTKEHLIQIILDVFFQDLLGGGESLMETLNSQTPSGLAALKKRAFLLAKLLGNSG